MCILYICSPTFYGLQKAVVMRISGKPAIWIRASRKDKLKFFKHAYRGSLLAQKFAVTILRLFGFLFDDLDLVAEVPGIPGNHVGDEV